jgi:hypothetical protein
MVRTMARQMELMQQELARLKQADAKREVVGLLEQQRAAAENPLTVDEKKALVAKVHKLPAHRMMKVVEIIQQSLPPDQQDSGEVEIPIDDLDTLTLRKLQTYVTSNGTSTASSSSKDKDLDADIENEKKKKAKKRKISPSTAAAAPSAAAAAALAAAQAAQAAKRARIDAPAAAASTWNQVKPPVPVPVPVPATTTTTAAVPPKLTAANLPVPPTAGTNINNNMTSPSGRSRSDSLEAADLLADVDNFLGDDDDDDDDTSGAIPTPNPNPTTTTNGWSTAKGSSATTTTSTTSVSGGAGWNAAIAAKNTATQSDRDRQAVTDKAANQRARLEAERLRSMQDLVAQQEASKKNSAEQEAMLKAKQAQDLELRRAEELRRREEMKPTVELDRGSEALEALGGEI